MRLPHVRGTLIDILMGQTVFRTRRTVFRMRHSVFRTHRLVFRKRQTVFRTHRLVFRKRQTVFRMGRTVFRMRRTVFRMRRMVFRMRRTVFRTRRSDVRMSFAEFLHTLATGPAPPLFPDGAPRKFLKAFTPRVKRVLPGPSPAARRRPRRRGG
jgi:hypothetical protein